MSDCVAGGGCGVEGGGVGGSVCPPGSGVRCGGKAGSVRAQGKHPLVLPRSAEALLQIGLESRNGRVSTTGGLAHIKVSNTTGTISDITERLNYTLLTWDLTHGVCKVFQARIVVVPATASNDCNRPLHPIRLIC